MRFRADLPQLPYDVRVQLFLHLAAMEKAGLPSDKAFGLLRLGGKWQARAAAATKLLARRSDLAGAGRISGLFTELETAIVRSSALAGSPADTYARLASRYALKARHRSEIKSKSILPAFMLVASCLINPAPEVITGTISGGGYLWRALSPLLQIGIAVAAWSAFSKWLKSDGVSTAKDAIDTAFLRMPLFGAISQRRTMRDFTENLALLLGAGLPMFEAVPVAGSTLGSTTMRKRIRDLMPSMRRGATLSEALLVFDGGKSASMHELLSMVVTGEASGTLPEMLMRFADSETEHLASFDRQLAEWIPRIFYTLVAVATAKSILSGHAFMPSVPNDL